MSNDPSAPSDPKTIDPKQAAITAGEAMIGKEIDGCAITRRLGQGGMGIVFLAEHTKLKQQYVIKVLNPALTAAEDTVHRFYREAQSVAKLGHPAIVQIHNVGQDGDYYFIRMEFVDGDTVENIVKREKKLDWKLATRIVLATADALTHAHKKGIIHRDIKPENIMLTKDGQVKVMDFGLAKQVQSSTQVSITGQIVGTPFFMSPEQAGGKQTDARSDLYSLGVTYYYLLTGVKPFNGKNLQEIFLKHFFYTPESPKIYTPGLPEEVCEIIRRCLKKKKKERYQSAAQLSKDLRAVLGEGEGGAEGEEADAGPVTAPPSEEEEGAPPPPAEDGPSDATVRAAAAAASDGGATVRAGAGSDAGSTVRATAAAAKDAGATVRAGVAPRPAAGSDSTLSADEQRDLAAARQEIANEDGEATVRTSADSFDPEATVGGGAASAAATQAAAVVAPKPKVQKKPQRIAPDSTLAPPEADPNKTVSVNHEEEGTVALAPSEAQPDAAALVEEEATPPKTALPAKKPPIIPIAAAAVVVVLGGAIFLSIRRGSAAKNEWNALESRLREVAALPDDKDRKAKFLELSGQYAKFAEDYPSFNSDASKRADECKKNGSSGQLPTNPKGPAGPNVGDMQKHLAEVKAKFDALIEASNKALERKDYKGCVEKRCEAVRSYGSDLPSEAEKVTIPLRVVSDPPGASVFIDRSTAAASERTPCTVFVRPFENHTIRIEREKFAKPAPELRANLTAYDVIDFKLTRDVLRPRVLIVPPNPNARAAPFRVDAPMGLDEQLDLVYAVARDGVLYQISLAGANAGTVRWSRKIGEIGDLAIPPEPIPGKGVVVANLGPTAKTPPSGNAPWSSAMLGLKTANRDEAWSVPLEFPVSAAPRLAPEAGVVVAGTIQGEVYVFELRSGAELARIGEPIEGAIVLPPAIRGNLAYVAADDDKLHVIDLAAKPKPAYVRSIDLRDVATAGPIFIGNSLVVGTRGGHLLKIDATDPAAEPEALAAPAGVPILKIAVDPTPRDAGSGKKDSQIVYATRDEVRAVLLQNKARRFASPWKAPTGEEVVGLAVAGDSIYVSAGSYVISLDAEGNQGRLPGDQIWDFLANHDGKRVVVATPPVVRNGEVFVITADGELIFLPAD